MTLKESYSQSLRVLEEHNCVPLFESKDWNGFQYKRNGVKGYNHYKVRCLSCQISYEVSFNGKNLRGRCPKCSKHRIVGGLHNSYLKALLILNKYRYRPLFIESEWKGFNSRKDGIAFHNHYLVECSEGHDFTAVISSGKGGVVTLCPFCKTSSFRSALEIQLGGYLERKGYSVIRNCRSIISFGKTPVEIDLYLPDLKVAFELNGLYWHSVEKHDAQYHLRKTEECLKKGILLYHLFNPVYSTCILIIRQVLKGEIPKQAFKQDLVLRDLCPQIPGDNYKFLPPEVCTKETKRGVFNYWNTGYWKRV